MLFSPLRYCIARQVFFTRYRHCCQRVSCLFLVTLPWDMIAIPHHPYTTRRYHRYQSLYLSCLCNFSTPIFCQKHRSKLLRPLPDGRLPGQVTQNRYIRNALQLGSPGLSRDMPQLHLVEVCIHPGPCFGEVVIAGGAQDVDTKC